MPAAIVVRLRMNLEIEGGRHAPFTEEYCPHLVVANPGDWLAVRVVQCNAPVHPGQEAIVTFSLMYYPGIDYSALIPGATFEVREGSRVVGTGKVLELLTDAA